MKQADYNNYKLGALKRKFKTGRGDVEAGTFISKVNAQKATAQKEAKHAPLKVKVAIMGM